ncbi:MAG: hypothetical protein ABWZ25_13365 [Chitinophagaceae bacterium]
MKNKLVHVGVITLFMMFILEGCSKEKGETNEEEVITTMILRFIPVGSSTPLVFEFSDPDGPGGAAPVADRIELSPNTTYNVSVQLLNETATPVEDITLEVKEENQAHRFYYQPTPASNITVSGLDNDVSGVPLGVNSSWTTGSAGTGQVTITLRHYPADPPNKSAADLVDSPKSGTDVEAVFNTGIN